MVSFQLKKKNHSINDHIDQEHDQYSISDFCARSQVLAPLSSLKVDAILIPNPVDLLSLCLNFR